jgi:hypothetical protein
MLSRNEKIVNKNFKKIDNMKNAEKLIENDSCAIGSNDIEEFKNCDLQISSYNRRCLD